MTNPKHKPMTALEKEQIIFTFIGSWWESRSRKWMNLGQNAAFDRVYLEAGMSFHHEPITEILSVGLKNK